MAFDVIAASYQHREKVRGPVWRTVMTGVTLGGVVVYLGVVGILTMFSERWIIVDVLNLGHALLIVAVLCAGFLTIRRTDARGTLSILSQGSSPRKMMRPFPAS